MQAAGIVMVAVVMMGGNVTNLSKHQDGVRFLPVVMHDNSHGNPTADLHCTVFHEAAMMAVDHTSDTA